MPGGGYEMPASLYGSVLCPLSSVDVVKGALLLVLVGVTFAVLWVTPWRFWAQANKLLSWEPGRGLHLQDRQSFLQTTCPKPLSS